MWKSECGSRKKAWGKGQSAERKKRSYLVLGNGYWVQGSGLPAMGIFINI